MSLLLNVAANDIGQTRVISADGATVSQAITYSDNLIDSPTGNYERAKTICDMINNGQMVRDFTYVDDIVTGILASADYGASRFEIINLGESRTVRLDYVITLLEEALGKKASIETLPAHAGDMPSTHADISKAETLLGYAPATPIETGIKAFVEWMRANSY